MIGRLEQFAQAAVRNARTLQSGRPCVDATPADMPEEPLRMSARAAEQILSRTFGRPIEIGCTESLGVNSRSQVLRCHVVDPPRGVPPTVIAKSFQADD